MSSMPFARIIRHRLKERGIGLRELCRGIGVDPSFFSKILAGKRSPPSGEEVLRKIAQHLDLDPSSLIVAAGRIPSEWQTLWTDPHLFHAVHRLIRQPAIKVRMSQETAQRSSSIVPGVFVPKALEDELL